LLPCHFSLSCFAYLTPDLNQNEDFNGDLAGLPLLEEYIESMGTQGSPKAARKKIEETILAIDEARLWVEECKG